jgi:flagellar hook protein FlgE
MQAVNQNGYASGTLSSTAFDQSGVLHGFYDNGQSRPLFQLPLARFPADQNLDSLGGNMFRESEDSGSPDIFSMGNDSDITIIAGAVEASTVDLTTEFSDMILTQQAYSSSANVFKTADEMIQTAAGIKR